MVIKETTIYICEHCRKVYQRKNACEHHEKWCIQNPENHRACHDCSHLKMKSNTIYRDTWQGEIEETVKALYCEKRDVYIIPLNAESKGNAYEFEDKENLPMFKQCDLMEGF